MMNSRTLVVFGLVLAGLCLIRVLSVAAATRSEGDVETYSSMEQGSSDDSDTRSSDNERNEIRLSRPGEAASRTSDDQGYEQVPGAARLVQHSSDDDSLIVPKKRGRSIASEQSAPALPPSPIEPRIEAAVSSPAPTRGDLKSSALSVEPIELKPFTAADARARAQESRGENILASNAPSGGARLGLHSEPVAETRIEPPVPATASGSRAGVQEISLIVSDYGYFPNKIFVTQNVPVKIYLTTPSKVTMCFMLDNWGLKKGVLPGRVEELTFTPDAPGDYRFYCPVKSIEGTVTVREAPSAAPASRGVASEEPMAGHDNTPKRAAVLRQLIED